MRDLLLATIMTSLVMSSAGLTARHPDDDALVTRFLARTENVPLSQYRAVRHLWARNERFNKEARVEALTTFDAANGFAYRVRTEEGSKIVRDRVLLPILKAEAKAWADGTAARSALTPANYAFSPGTQPGWLTIQPRRMDTLLIDGAILINTDDGDLRRISGRLARNPSWWTTRVEVTREYRRIGAVRVPVAVTSHAWVRMAGKSTLEMTYEYEEINGVTVGPGRPAHDSGDVAGAAGAESRSD